MLASVVLLGGRTSANSANVGDPGALMDAQGYVVSSETALTSWGSLSTAALGPIGTVQKFRFYVLSGFLFAGRVLLRLPWTLNTQSAGGINGTLRASLLINGVQVGTADGKARNLNSANGTKFAELIEINVTTPVLASPGQIIEIQIQPLITTAGASTFTPDLRHNPQSVDDQLVAEFQGAA